MFGSTNPFGQQSSGGAFGQQASSNPFGGQAGGAFGQQASSNPFGGQTSAFGQTGGAASNSFAPKPFGSSVTAFGQPSAPAFGATSTGAFGQLSAPAFGSTSTGAFGQQATPAFGSTLTGAFGQQSAPMFGSTVTGAFGQQSAPAFGTTSTGAFGQQSTPAFGTTSTGAFGQQSAPAFGSTSTGAFGQPSTAVFGTPSPSPFGSSTPAFGASPTPAFGATSSGFGSGSLFGQKPSFGGFGSSPSQSSTFGSTFQQTQPAFGNSTFGATTPAFGSSSTSLFGASSNTTFGSTTPAFGSSGTGTFGVNTAPASSFGTSASAFSFGSSPSFGQTTATTGTTSFGTNPFGSQAAATTFGQSSFGNQSGGTRIQSYVQTPDPDSATSGTQPAAKFDSISAMPAYKEKSHEELRWEDYQRQDKGGPNPSAAPAVNSFLPPQQNFQPNQPIAANTFAPKPSPFATTPSPFSSSTSTQSFGQPVGAFSANTSPSLFANSTSSIFNPPSTTTNPFSTGSSINNNTQSAGLFQPSPAITQQPFSNSFNQQASTPAFSTSMFNTSSLGMTGGLFSNTSPPFATSTFQQPAPVQTTSSFSFQTQPGAFSGVSNMMNLAPFGQQTTSQPNMVMQPTMVPSPFGTLPVMPRMSIGNGGSSPSIQYGISSLPVAEKSLPSRTLLMVVPRHLSQRRIKLLPRKYNSTSDGKVPFFADDEESPATPKADAFFIPRENPRSLIIRSTEHWPSRTVLDRQSIPRDSADLEKHIDASVGRERNKAAMSPSRTAPVENRDDQHASSEPEASARHTNGATIEKQQQQQLMPKLLSQADYFTEPSLAELAAKERAEPGCCGRVKDFVVGRRGYGSIKFLGETDVRGLDVESIVEFNQREVVVYKDDSKKPPVGEGLNRAAVVSLLKIKCMNKKTGDQYTEGPRVDRYREMLAKKAEEQGAEFISFDAANGEWKFRVKHFSSYGFAGAAQEEEAQGNSCGL